MKTKIGTSAEYPDPKPEPGWSVWIENGVWFTAPTVDPEKFGEHAYWKQAWVGNCKCGCEMHSSSSSGSVDPFGACPENPKQ